MQKKVAWIGNDPEPSKTKFGDVYYYNIEWSDGKSGQFASKFCPQKKFKVEETYNVTIVRVSPKGTDMYDIIKEQQYSQEANSNFKDPGLNFRIQKEVSAEAALDICCICGWGLDILGEVIKECMDFLDGKEEQRAASNALRRAVQKICLYEKDNDSQLPLINGRALGITEIIKDANAWYTHFMQEKPKEQE